MCGVIGIVGTKPVAKMLIEGLKRLAYRGYDSSGIAVIDPSNNQIKRLRKAGKLNELEAHFQAHSIDGQLGIAHTRWATHGIPNEINAHPHMTERVAMVHNGIIENHQILRDQLGTKGYTFESQTDTEVALKVLDDLLKSGMHPLQAVQKLITIIKGAYALVMIFRDYPDLMIGTRKGSPLLISQNDQNKFLSSDSLAVDNYATKIAYLEEGDIVTLTPHLHKIYDHTGHEVNRPFARCYKTDHVSKNNYPHYMLKEIHDQPDVIRKTLTSLISNDRSKIHLADFNYNFKSCKKITIVACGSSYYAALVAKYWFEQIARLSCEIDIASEFRYRQPPLIPSGLSIFISQSGETADTLAAHNYAKLHNQTTLGIVNVANSTLNREADYTLLTQAGSEMGVASTKAFTTQLTVLACLALLAAQQCNYLNEDKFLSHITQLFHLPHLIDTLLNDHTDYRQVAEYLKDCCSVLYLGRGTSYAIAMEGALKLKEISYIHAEGFAAGEMKHGPIALIDEHLPIIVLAPSDNVLAKTLSNVQEAAARQGKIILITDEHASYNFKNLLAKIIMPLSSPIISPILYTVVIQLIAYYTAVLKGTDVDQPRNLAKSVTVE